MRFLIVLLLAIVWTSSVFGSSNLGSGFSFSSSGGVLSFSGTPHGSSSSFTLNIASLDEINSVGTVVRSSSFETPQVGSVTIGSIYESVDINVPISVNGTSYFNMQCFTYLQAATAAGWPGTSFNVPENGLVALVTFAWPVVSTTDFFQLSGTIGWDISAADVIDSLFTSLQLTDTAVTDSAGDTIGETVGIKGGLGVTAEIPATPIFNATTTGGSPKVNFALGTVAKGASGTAKYTLTFQGISGGAQVPVLMILNSNSASTYGLPAFLIIAILVLMKTF